MNEEKQYPDLKEYIGYFEGQGENPTEIFLLSQKLAASAMADLVEKGMLEQRTKIYFYIEILEQTFSVVTKKLREGK